MFQKVTQFLPVVVCLGEQQLFSVCKSMQTRVVELIPQLLDEGLVGELLVVNDDLNNLFIRYERRAAAVHRELSQVGCKVITITVLLL